MYWSALGSVLVLPDWAARSKIQDQIRNEAVCLEESKLKIITICRLRSDEERVRVRFGYDKGKVGGVRVR